MTRSLPASFVTVTVPLRNTSEPTRTDVGACPILPAARVPAHLTVTLGTVPALRHFLPALRWMSTASPEATSRTSVRLLPITAVLPLPTRNVPPPLPSDWLDTSSRLALARPTRRTR